MRSTYHLGQDKPFESKETQTTCSCSRTTGFPWVGGGSSLEALIFFGQLTTALAAWSLFIMGLVILQHWFTIAENLFRASNHYHSKDHTHQYPMNMVSRSRKLPLKFIYEYLGRWRKYSELSEFILFTTQGSEEQHFKREETKQLGRRAKSWDVPSILVLQTYFK